MANAHHFHQYHKQHAKQQPPPVETQPRLFRFTLKGLLNLPYRLCNPPPAVAKVRSCGLTPIFKVKLEDVLDRKHLPPLGLKDFEEWLLFVEQCPENLYFILWLRDYTAKYNQWAAKSKQTRSKLRLRDRQREGESEIEKVEKGRTGGYRVNWPASTTVSPSLAMSYARAKQTFFAPNSDYALCVPPDLLSPFFRVNDDNANPNAHQHPQTTDNGSTVACSDDEHTNSAHYANKYFGSPHPDPEVFTDVALYVQNRLNNSLRNCVRAAYSNVGTFRATCGICAGLFLILATALPPLLVNFLRSQNRWLRLAAIPGLWLGLTIFCASMKGVCMMVYVFGDFRQLRKFELARPPLPGTVGEEGKNGLKEGHLTGADTKNGAPYVRPPVSPPVALTAPPRMPVHLPSSRVPPTPSLTYSHGNSYSYYSRPTTSSGGSVSMTDGGDTTLHTISISSSRNPGGPDADGDEDGDASSVSVPACDSSDDDSSIGGRRRRRSSFYAGGGAGAGRAGPPARPRRGGYHEDEVDDSDEEDDEDDCGIYISPAYAPPDEMAELELIDPAAVEMVVAAAARAGIASEASSPVVGPGQREGGEGHMFGGPGSHEGGNGVGNGDGVEREVKDEQEREKEKEKVVHPPPPTAAFIPPFEYRYMENNELWAGPAEGGRVVKGKSAGDLEKGVDITLGAVGLHAQLAPEPDTRSPTITVSPLEVLTVTKTGTPLPFDFDALPPVKRDAAVTCARDHDGDTDDDYGNGRTLMKRFSFLRVNTQTQLPTHIEAQVHVQVDSDAEVNVLGAGDAERRIREEGARRSVSFEDMRRETVTSTTLTVMSQGTRGANVNVNGAPSRHMQPQPQPMALSPTPTMLNTQFSSLHEKGNAGNAMSSMVMSPVSVQSAMTYIGSIDEKGGKKTTATMTATSPRRGFFSTIASYIPIVRLMRSDRPSGCNDFHKYAYSHEDHAHHFKTRKARRAAASKRDFTYSHYSASGASSDDSASIDSWQPRLAIARHVPAFGPVTRVLNPVVTRAQWEIVVRAAALAFVLTVAVVGALCAAPVPGRG